MNIEDSFSNIYNDDKGGSWVRAIGGGSRVDVNIGKMVHEVWRDISLEKCRFDVRTVGGAMPREEMMLEDFSSKGENKLRVMVVNRLIRYVNRIMAMKLVKIQIVEPKEGERGRLWTLLIDLQCKD
jgi:hypothetical protein